MTDPGAVSSVWTIFASGPTDHQRLAVQLFGQIDSPDSTRALSLLGVVSDSGEVRGRSIETLRRRDPHDVASFLIGLFRDPQFDPDPILYRYALQPTGWHAIGSIGFLFVKGPLYDIFRTYTVDESRSSSWPSGAAPMEGYVSRIMAQRQQQLQDLGGAIRRILSESESFVTAAKLHVQAVDEHNARIIRVLDRGQRVQPRTGPASLEKVVDRRTRLCI